MKPPDDPPAHATLLQQRFREEHTQPATDIGGYDQRRLIKIRLNQKVPPDSIARACGGVEVVSQEDGTLILAFATETQLADFEAKLTRFAKGEQVSYNMLLYALQDFDRWTPQDRTGLALREDGFPADDEFTIDAELWPLAIPREADRQRSAFERWITENDAAILDAVRQPHLTVFRIRCGPKTADLLLHHRDVRLLDLPPRMTLQQPVVYGDIEELDPVPSPPADAPSVVVLDTGVVTGHPLLSPAVGDSQSFVEGLPAADDHGHGTFVAGIALYDDVARMQRFGKFVPELRLFSGRVLDAKNEGDPDLIENVVDRAVRYFVTEYDCRVFNLSYGNLDKPYRGRHVSGLAVTLDMLSRELNVLFVVPTGNFLGTEEGPENWREDYPKYLAESSSRLLDPAPALNALTVGSLARHEHHQRWPEDPGYRPIARTQQPSPFTRRGPSVNGAVKPDLVDYGDNWIVSTRAGDHLLDQAPVAGEISVAHGFAAGRPFAKDVGTSFAAPRVANAAAKVFAEFPGASTDLCRALLLAHARTPESCRILFENDRDNGLNLTGYGLVDRSALYRSVENCVTLWAADKIPDRHHHFFEIPIPDEYWLDQPRVRALTVALAYRPPMRTTRIDYRASRVSFKLVQADSLDQVAQWFNAAVSSDDLDKIPERTGGRGLSETVRSKGTAQATTWTFKRPSTRLRERPWFVVVTRNDTPWGRHLTRTNEPYALAVALDDRFEPRLQIEAALYTQVQKRLRARARARESR